MTLCGLTAGEFEVADVLVERVEAELHPLANDRQVGSEERNRVAKVASISKAESEIPEFVVDGILPLDLQRRHLRHHLRLVEFNLFTKKQLAFFS